VEAFPAMPRFRGTLALLLLRTADPAGALATLDALEDSPEALADPDRAVYAAALARLGRDAESAALAKRIDWGSLAPAEAHLLQESAEP
jgi:hypothetical protein